MRRVVRFILIASAGLVVLVVVGVQVVLWTDYPRRVVVGQLRDRLGLEVEVASLSVGWLGGSTLEGVRIALPLEDRPLVEAPAVRVEHASLPWAAITGDVGLSSLTIERPRGYLRQRDDGAWNAGEVARIIRARLGGGEGSGRGGAASIPAVVLRGGTLVIEPRGRDAVTLEGVEAAGEAVSRLDYRVRVEAPRLGEAAVGFTPAAPWRHEAAFALAPSEELVGALLGAPPEGVAGEVAGEVAGGVGGELGGELPGVTAAGSWRGSFDGGVFSGRLDLDALTLGGHAAAGRVGVRFEAATRRLTAAPEALEVFIGGGEQPVRITRGQVAYRPGADVEVTRLLLSGLGFDAVVSGAIDPRRQTGELRVRWQQTRAIAGVTQRGRGTLTLGRAGGGRRIELDASAAGDSPWGPVEAGLLVTARGPAWDRLAGSVAVERLALLRDGSAFNLDGAAATWSLAERRLSVHRLQLPEGAAPRRLAARGFYDFAARTWEADAVAAAFVLPGVPFAIDRFTLEAAGDGERARFESITFAAGGVRLEADGAYAFAAPEPLDLTVRLTQAPIRLGGDEDRRLSADNLFGVLKVRGAAGEPGVPLTLRAQGRLTARQLRLGEDLLGDIAMEVEGAIEPERLAATVVAPAWLGGRWRAEAAIDREAERGRVEVVGEDLDLQIVQAALGGGGSGGVGGSGASGGSGGWLTGLGGVRVSIAIPRTDPRAFEATGEFSATGVAAALSPMQLAAEEVRGTVALDVDRLRLSGVRATLDGATLTGSATIPLGGGPVQVHAESRDWPVRFEEAGALAVATGSLDLAVFREGVRAEGALRTRWTVRDEAVAALDFDARVDRGRLELRRLGGEVLDGAISGRGVIDLARLVGSDLALSWKGVQPAALAPFWPPLGRVEGGFSGTLLVQHTDDPRALAPLKMIMEFDAAGATMRGVTFGSGSGVAYTDGERWVLEALDLQGVGGELSLWGRLSPHGGQSFAFVSAAARNLDIAAISRALEPDAPPALGRLSMELTLSLPVDDWRLAFGRGSIRVTDADFGAIPLFGELYDLVNLRLGAYAPNGRGRGDIRIEQGYVILPAFRFQNRGAQFAVALRVHDLWAGEESPVSGYATASQRLLPEVAFFGSVGEAIDLLQQELTPHRITGTLADPELVAEPLRRLGEAFGEVLVAPLRESAAPSSSPQTD